MQTAMSKKDYETIAEIISAHRTRSVAISQEAYEAAVVLTGELVVAFKRDNPRFDADRFVWKTRIKVLTDEEFAHDQAS